MPTYEGQAFYPSETTMQSMKGVGSVGVFTCV